MQHFTLNPKSKIKKQEERRRRERRRREEEYRRRIGRLRRQIEEARKRRQRILLLFLLAVLAMKESILAAFRGSYIDWSNPDPGPLDWTPDPAADFAPRHGSDDHCDGYSREQWNRMLDERGIKVSRKAEITAVWEADPVRELFPERYQLWGHRPYVSQIMPELTAPYWREDALAALKLLTPREVHTYLDEASVTDPGDLRRCFADRDQEIIAAFQQRSALWEERKKIEAQDARKAKRENRPDDDENKFEP